MRQSLHSAGMNLPGVTKVQKPASSLVKSSGLEKDEKYEIKSGKLLLFHRIGQRSAWLPVYVRVYRNAFEHFAVVSKDQAISANSTYVNLKASGCGEPGGSGVTQFKVILNNYEGTVITFDAGDKDTVSDWVDAFASNSPPSSPCRSVSPTIPRSPVLPTLPELDEEE